MLLEGGFGRDRVPSPEIANKGLFDGGKGGWGGGGGGGEFVDTSN